MCALARPKMTMLNHLSLWKITEYDVLARIRAGYDGVVGISEDRMELLVGSDIKLFPPSASLRRRRTHDERIGASRRARSADDAGR